jgi:hypothetical protein
MAHCSGLNNPSTNQPKRWRSTPKPATGALHTGLASEPATVGAIKEPTKAEADNVSEGRQEI